MAVIVPCHNEERFITGVLEGMPEFVDLVFVVDDASTDATAEMAEGVGDPRVQVIRHRRNKGVGAGTVTGYTAALEAGADVLVVMDGDGQMDPAHLPELLDPVVDGRVEFAKANRFFSATSFAAMPKVRVAGNVALTFLTKAASGYWDLVDPQNGYTALSASAARRLDLRRLATGYDFNNDLLVWLNIADATHMDVPVAARYGNEESGLSPMRVAGPIAWRLFRGFWRRIFLKYVLWSFSPIAVLMFTGLLLLGIGAVGAVLALMMGFGPRPLPAATVALAVLPGTTGIYLLTQALILDIQASATLTRRGSLLRRENS